jgi:hypothetical protein
MKTDKNENKLLRSAKPINLIITKSLLACKFSSFCMSRLMGKQQDAVHYHFQSCRTPRLCVYQDHKYLFSLVSSLLITTRTHTGPNFLSSYGIIIIYSFILHF